MAREGRWAWVDQRVRDARLPLWKRQRAMVYLSNKDCLVELERYLQWLQGLEPTLRAFGLQRSGLSLSYQRGPKAADSVSLGVDKGERSWIARALEALRGFLEAEQPVEVRREAAWVIAAELLVPQYITEWEEAAQLGVEWWQGGGIGLWSVRRRRRTRWCAGCWRRRGVGLRIGNNLRTYASDG
ncbi:MAG: hypothetical protein RMJ83_05680 [Armatimonadota bacterium]|nr:hypothetical protein [Armatimonadota bacterium]